MKITTGTVVDGKVVVDGETLREGSTVTVLLREDDEAFELTPEEEEERSRIGPVLCSLPETRWPQVRRALLVACGFGNQEAG